MEEIEKYLNKNYGTMDESTTETKTKIINADFDKSTNEYHKLTSATLERLRRNNKKEMSEARTLNNMFMPTAG